MTYRLAVLALIKSIVIFIKLHYFLQQNYFITILSSERCNGHRWRAERKGDSTYSAQFATADEDSTFVKHTSVEMEHVIDIYCNKVLCQVSLQRSTQEEKNKQFTVQTMIRIENHSNCHANTVKTSLQTSLYSYFFSCT